MKRRDFIKLSTLTLAGFTVGCSAFGSDLKILQSKVLPQGKDFLWININPQNETTLIVPSSEMGQGIHTALAQIVAEELSLDWDKITVITGSGHSEYESVPAIGQLTGGSTSVKQWWEPMRKIGASVADVLLRAGSIKLNKDIKLCKLENSFVICGDKKISFGELSKLASTFDVKESKSFKNTKDYQYVGKSIKRLDLLDKVTGKAKFGIDSKIPNMKYATIMHAPIQGASLKSMSKKSALSIQGVSHVVELENGVAVVGDNYFNASKGLEALKPVFKNPEKMPIKDSHEVDKKLSSFLKEMDDIDIDKNSLDVEYSVPFLAHGAMEPMNATADVRIDSCVVYAPTQAQTSAIDAVKEVTGLDDEQISLHTTQLGGGFGRRAESDYVKEVVVISKKIKAPVKLVWSREEDMRNDYYRSASKSRFQVKWNDKGEILSLKNHNTSKSVLKRFVPIMRWLGIAPIAVEGASESIYNIKDYDFSYDDLDVSVNVGFWRSVGHSHNAFFIESAIDEVAHKMKKDPLEFRLSLLQSNKRHYKVLNEVKKISNWGNPPEGYAQGVATHKSFSSIMATVVEVKINSEKLELGNCYCVIDAGKYINPAIVQAQVFGGTHFGLSSALFEEITIKDYKIEQGNYPDYPIMRMKNSMDVKVVLLESDGDIGGVGEVATPTVAPALTNAIFAAKNIRIRSLPIKNSMDIA